MKPLLAVVTVGLLAAAAPAPAQLPTRHIAAPPTDVLTGVVRRPDPFTVGTSAAAAAIPFDLTRDPDGVWRATLPLHVGDPSSARLLIASPDIDRWRTTLRLGEAPPVMLDADLRAGGFVAHRGPLGLAGLDVDATMYAVTSDQSQWLLEIEAPAPPRHHDDGIADGVVLLACDHPATLYACVDGPARVGEPVTLLTTLYDRTRTTHRPGDAPPVGMEASGHRSRVTIDGRPVRTDAFVWGARESTGVDTLHFDTPGVHAVTVDVEAAVDGRRVRRTVHLVVPVTAHHATITEASTELRADVIHVTLNLADASLPGHVRAGAELWGQGADGPVPVCWFGGMASPHAEADATTLDLSLHADWISLAGVTGPFELRHLRLEDPDHHVILAARDRLPIALPAAAITRPRVGAVTPVMLHGVLDPARTIPTPPVETARDVGAHNLMLVHGYCAGGNPFPVAQFTGAREIFSDPNQTRSQDQFALLIGALGNQSKSFGVVAHSQGGLASLHLYTYYWSGLDWARGPRLIQSLGSPYQGTALAGDVAALGDVFGAGCGENPDLDYDGAAAWLSGIPTWARQAVHYHTTSFEDRPFGFDYCNFLTDFFLTDPEDGVTEQWAGQLPGAVNRGHVTGWCHTTDMRDPAQYLDASRNAIMNQEAAR